MRKKGFLKKSKNRIQKFQLQDITKSNLFRDIFPYPEVPRIKVDHKLEIMGPPEDIFITDTTFRDGQQFMSPSTVKQNIMWCYMLTTKFYNRNHA